MDEVISAPRDLDAVGGLSHFSETSKACLAAYAPCMSGSYVKEDGSKVYTIDVRVSKQEFADSRKEAGEQKPSEAYMDPNGIDDAGLPFN